MAAEQLSAAQRAKIRRLSRPKELAPDEEGGELNIIPFLDIVVNILIFVLATVAVTFTASIETNSPTTKGSGVRREIQSEALNFTLLLVEEGIAIKASGRNVASGCQGPGPGIAIPNKNGRYDWASLKACAQRLKSASPDFAEERLVYITAQAGVEYQNIISAIGSVRSGPNGEPLFTEVQFQRPR